MGAFDWLFGSNAELGNSELPQIFPFQVRQAFFVEADILQTYQKILTDVAERTHGLNEKQEKVLWDSAVANNAPKGLITLLATAMVKQQELYLVLKSGVLRPADEKEKAQIQADYKKSGESKVGVYISFKDYERTELLKIYSNFEYCILGSLNKNLNIAKAIQLKISDLRQSVSLQDSGIAREQAKSIASALGKGNDVFFDAKDSIDTSTIDMAPTEKAMLFVDGKRSFILGLPLSYVKGEQVGGLNATGEADMRAIERGLRQYFVSIIKPVFQALFGVDVEFKSQDFRFMATGLEVLKAFDLASGENLSMQTMREITARVFDVDPEQEQERLDAEQAERDAEKAKIAEQQAAQLAALNGGKPGASATPGNVPQPGAKNAPGVPAPTVKASA